MPEEYVQSIRGENHPWTEAVVRDDEGHEWLTGGLFRHPLLPEFYEPGAQVRELNRRAVDAAAVSPVPTLFYYDLDGDKTLALHRMVNDRIADLVAAYPDRFVGLATVPLQSPALAVMELERAMLVKGLRGVEIGTNIGGRNLDEAEFRPFFRRAVELGAFVFIHPIAVLGADRLRRYYLTNLIGNPTDTAVAIASLIFGGVYDQLPGLTCCFAHGGGSFPMLIGRWDHGYRVRPECKSAISRPPRDYLPLLYVDSLTHDDRVRQLVVDTVGADHMMIGSDHPFDMGDPDSVQRIEQLQDISDDDRQLILGQTAARLLGL